jgi:hypothetical protein
MKTSGLATTLLASLPSLLLAQQPAPKAPSTTIVLPQPDFHFKGNVGRTISESDPPQFPQMARPPAGAPNIVIVLIEAVEVVVHAGQQY